MSRICIIGALVASAFAFAAGTTASAQSDDSAMENQKCFRAFGRDDFAAAVTACSRAIMFDSDNEWAYVERCSA